MFILDFRKDAGEFINKFVIGFVSGIYKLVDYAYRVFMVLAKTNIFSEENFKDITSNIYKILAVAMLFILAYAILLKIVDPDGSTKGIDGKKTFQNFIIAIILIILCPSIFSFAYGLQSAILDSGIIGGIITGNVGNANSENVTNANIYGGILMSVNTFEVFFRPVGGLSGSDVKGATNIGEVVASKPVLSLDGSSEDLYINCDGSQSEECSYDAAFLFAQNTGSFAPMKAFALNMYDNEIDFDWFAAFIVGLLLIYVIISFCFDMGIRVCKLAFFQMIAPIGIICMAIPKMEDVFKKWLSNTTKTYLSVFIRTLVMSFGVYLISLVANNPLFSDETGGQTGVPIFNLMAKCFLIMGIVVFIKQSPKLLGDIFGIGDGDMKLGIKDKLKAGGAFAAGAAIGAGTTGLVRNAVNAGQNFKKAPKDKKFGAVVKGIGSTLAGGASGFTKGVWYAKDAGSGKDMKNALNKAADATVENRNKREAYKAAHPGFGGVQKGHIMDAVRSAGSYFGVDSLASLKKEKETADKMQGFYKTMASYVEDNEAVANFAGLYEAERKREISDTVFDEKNYMTALEDKYSQIMEDSKYKGMTDEQKKAIATSQVDKSNFVRKISSAEMARALQEKEANLKRLDSLKKLATIRAVNEKLNKKAADGTIIDSRFQAVVNEAKVFKQQNANYDFVQDMSEISGLTWDKSWNDIMYNNNNLSLADYNAAVDKLMSDMKAGTTGVKYFSDSENAKNHSGAVSAEISKQIQKQQEGK